MKQLLTLGLVILLTTPGYAQTWTEDLQTAVDSQDWDTAIDIIDQQINQDPERTNELEDYRRQLEALLEAQSRGREPIAQNADRVTYARSTVALESTRRNLLYSGYDLGRQRVFRDYEILPSRYRVTVFMQAPVDIPAEHVTVTASIDGFGETSQMIQIGSLGVHPIEYSFSASDLNKGGNRLVVETTGGDTVTTTLSTSPRPSTVVGTEREYSSGRTTCIQGRCSL